MAKKKKKDGEALSKAKAAKEVKPKKSKKAKKDQKIKKAKKVRVAEPMDDIKDAKKGKKEEKLETIANIVDHPLVADLVAAGAVAAVGALAEKKVTTARGKSTGSKAALKLAGAAAASAIGKRLMAEFEEAKARREEDDGEED